MVESIKKYPIFTKNSWDLDSGVGLCFANQVYYDYVYGLPYLINSDGIDSNGDYKCTHTEIVESINDTGYHIGSKKYFHESNTGATYNANEAWGYLLGGSTNYSASMSTVSSGTSTVSLVGKSGYISMGRYYFSRRTLFCSIDVTPQEEVPLISQTFSSVFYSSTTVAYDYCTIEGLGIWEISGYPTSYTEARNLVNSGGTLIMIMPGMTTPKEKAPSESCIITGNYSGGAGVKYFMVGALNLGAMPTSLSNSLNYYRATLYVSSYPRTNEYYDVSAWMTGL